MSKGRSAKVALLSGILLIIIADVVFFFCNVELISLWIAISRSSPYCNRLEAFRGLVHYAGISAAEERLTAASRLVRTDPVGLQLLETPQGRLWFREGGLQGMMWELAEQERQLYGSGDWGVHTGDVVLDCGANVGLFTREALKSGAKLVVAIEPAPENLECLRRNVASDIAAGRVIVYPKGVWDKDDFLVMNMHPENSGEDSFVLHGGRAEAEGRVRLPLTTIDKLVSELRLEKVDFIKMDIEGAEQRALAGAQATLAKHHPRLALAAYHLPGDPVGIPALVRQAWAGYRMQCGPCRTPTGFIRPETLHFR